MLTGFMQVVFDGFITYKCLIPDMQMAYLYKTKLLPEMVSLEDIWRNLDSDCITWDISLLIIKYFPLRAKIF